ncbi:MAG: low molecular weight protein-tyrosine-phosphatase [Betaproteobacteria bacterium]
MRPSLSVLVVCTGNICRSPTGEAVLRRLVHERGLAERIAVASAGTHDYHVGQCPDSRAIRHASRRGYDLTPLRASQVTRADFHRHDYILAMDRGHLRILRALAPSDAKARLGLFLEASAQWKGEDVPDPYYGGVEGFERVLDMVEEAAQRWVERFEAELDPSRFRLQGPR